MKTEIAPHGFTFDFDGAYRAAGWADGIAWYVYDFESEPDEDTEWTGYTIATGRVLAHMVGDDQTYAFDPEDLERLGDDAYCRDCGQVGCGHNVYV